MDGEKNIEESRVTVTGNLPISDSHTLAIDADKVLYK